MLKSRLVPKGIASQWYSVPCKLRDIVERLAGFGKIPVYYAGKSPVAPKSIPRGHIAVADNLAWLPAKVRDVPLNTF